MANQPIGTLELSPLRAYAALSGIEYWSGKMLDGIEPGPHVLYLTPAAGAKTVGQVEAFSGANSPFDILPGGANNRPVTLIEGLGLVMDAGEQADAAAILALCHIQMKLQGRAFNIPASELIRIGGVVAKATDIAALAAGAQAASGSAGDELGGCPNGTGLPTIRFRRAFILGLQVDDALSLRWDGTPTIGATPPRLKLVVWGPAATSTNAVDFGVGKEGMPGMPCELGKTINEVQAFKAKGKLAAGY
jgi:hypothetical protein